MKKYDWQIIPNAGHPHKGEYFVSFRPTSVKLSVQFCNRLQLEKNGYTHCSVKVDKNNLALLLEFLTKRQMQEMIRNNSMRDGCYEIQYDGGGKARGASGKASRSCIQCGVVMQQDWIKSIWQQPDKRKKRFAPIETELSNQWIVEVVPGFSHRVEAEFIDIAENLNGIYCYLSASNDVLYIGRGQLRNRFNCHARQKDIPAKFFCYTAIEDENLRAKAEAFHLRLHVMQHGKLPPFNKALSTGKTALRKV